MRGCALAAVACAGLAIAGEPNAPGSRPAPRGQPPAAPPATAPAPPERPRPPAGGPATAAAAAELQREQDVVLLTNGHRILGRVQADAARPDRVAIHTGAGTIFLPRESVREVQRSMASRLAEVAANPDDLALRTATARWCWTQHRAQARRQPDDAYHAAALDLLDAVADRPDLDAASYGLYAYLVDYSAKRGPKQAIALYRRYRSRGGSEAIYLDRLRALEGAMARNEAENPPVVVASTAVGAAGGPAPAPAAPALPAPTASEGLETRNFQPGSEQWSNPVAVEVVSSGTGAERRRLLQISFKPGDKDKAVAERRVNWTVTDDSVLGFAIANATGKPLRVAIAVKTGPKWDYFESPQEIIAPGNELRDLRFDLRADRFKCKASDWTPNAAITGLDDIKAIQVLIYNGDVEGAVYLAGMGFRRPGPL